MPALPWIGWMVVAAAPVPRAEVVLTGDWALRVEPGVVQLGERAARVAAAVELTIEPPERVTVGDEEYRPLPFFDPQQPPWRRGAPLRGLVTQETTARYALDPATLRVKPAPGDAAPLEPERDYGVLLDWGCIGRIDGSRLPEGAPAYVDYVYGLCRLDTIAVNAAGAVRLVRGAPHVNVPHPPELAEDELPLCNVWLTARLEKLGPANLFPIESTGYPEPPIERPTLVERFCPKTLAKLRAGEPVRILAWGDSVTVGTFAGEGNQWQQQFVRRLQERFPKARIELINHGWGGRNSQSFQNEPPGSPFNYQETVVGARADLVVTEFVNDSGLGPEQVEERYSRILSDFQGVGSEWIILTPHYVRPDWMGLASERDCDLDPRPYVAALRAFGPRHGVPIADASLRWGHLWREGIPYMTLMLNAINHPDARGMKLFADALMAIFPPE